MITLRSIKKICIRGLVGMFNEIVIMIENVYVHIYDLGRERED